VPSTNHKARRRIPNKLRLAAALLCERVLLEKDDVASVIRLVDTFYVTIPKELPAGATPAIPLTLLLSFKRSDEPDMNTHQVKLKIQPPQGPIQDLPMAMDFGFKPGEVASSNLIITIQFGAKEFGRFRLDVFVDGEGPIAEIPFMLLERTEPKTPERGH
jgi:hypothetical protein